MDEKSNAVLTNRLNREKDSIYLHTKEFSKLDEYYLKTDSLGFDNEDQEGLSSLGSSKTKASTLDILKQKNVIKSIIWYNFTRKLNKIEVNFFSSCS